MMSVHKVITICMLCSSPGRYNKYSRDLPQTPWFVEGERKMGSSVQELICDTLNRTVHAEGKVAIIDKIGELKGR